MSRNQEEIKAKGFDMVNRGGSEEYDPYKSYTSTDFAKIKVGLQMLDDALSDVNFYKEIVSSADKETILDAIYKNRSDVVRELSDFFFRSSGVYQRLVKYLANLYRLDWFIYPVVVSNAVKPEKIEEGFFKALTYIDNFNVKKTLGDISLKVIKDGCFYGYKIQEGDKTVIQELPVDYCRSRFYSDGKPVVEFNMQYFDDTFRDPGQRIRMIKIFPREFQKGYILFKEGKLEGDYLGDTRGWYMLDVNNTVKFNVDGDDMPVLAAVLPALIDLAEAQELDRRKMMQQLLKIIIQKMPIDKNGDLIFDVDEAKALHNNAVSMLSSTIGVDVLTTFADVDVADMAERSTVATMDELTKIERGVFNEAGVSQMQFNTNGNLALERSIANDEASMNSLLAQFQQFLNELLAPFNKTPKKLFFRLELLPTTIYNYKELSKTYKEQMALGFSKLLPQIALGQSQSSILAMAYFENEILNLNELFNPPAMSSTKSGSTQPSGEGPGRKPLPDDQKSDKTLKNKESMS